MRGDFLQNLITRHRGIEPVLQPRPISRFETENSSFDVAETTVNSEPASEPQNFQTASRFSDLSVHESRFDQTDLEHVSEDHRSSAISPSIVSREAGQRNVDPIYPDTQQTLTSSQQDISRLHLENVSPASVSAEKSRTAFSERFSRSITDSDRQSNNNQFEKTESAGIFGSEKPIAAIDEPVVNKTADPSVRSTKRSDDFPQSKSFQPVEHNVGIDMEKMVREMRDEIMNQVATENETSGREKRVESNLLLPEATVHVADKPLHSPIEQNAVLGELKASERQLESEPTINVTIGRVEVRAVHKAESPRRKRQQQRGVMSLDEYLTKRGGKS